MPEINRKSWINLDKINNLDSRSRKSETFIVQAGKIKMLHNIFNVIHSSYLNWAYIATNDKFKY